MNYNDIIKEKKDLEDSILKRIQQYEEKTGFHVNNVSTEWHHYFEKRNKSTTLVKITLDI